MLNAGSEAGRSADGDMHIATMPQRQAPVLGIEAVHACVMEARPGETGDEQFDHAFRCNTEFPSHVVLGIEAVHAIVMEACPGEAAVKQVDHAFTCNTDTLQAKVWWA